METRVIRQNRFVHASEEREEDKKWKHLALKVIKYLWPGILLLSLSIQTIQLLQNYHKYPTVQSVRFHSYRETQFAAAVTFCDQFETMVSFYYDVGGVGNVENVFDNVIFTQYNQLYCVTYLSHLAPEIALSKAPEPAPLYQVAFVTSVPVSHAQIHSAFEPPRMLDSIKPVEGFIVAYNIELTTVSLIPAPYDTNCRIYDNPKEALSRDDCLYRCRIGASNISEIYIDNIYRFVDEINRRINQNRLLKPFKTCSERCRTHCQVQHYNQHKKFDFSKTNMLDFFMAHARLPRYFFYLAARHLVIEHEGEFTFLFLIIQFGGLVALYFGLAVVDIRDSFFKKKLLKFYANILLRPLFLLVCTYQCFLVCYEYLQYQTITSLILDKDFQEQSRFPILTYKLIPPSPLLLALKGQSAVDYYFGDQSFGDIFPLHQTLSWSGQKNVSKAFRILKDACDVNLKFQFFYDRSHSKEIQNDVPLKNKWYIANVVTQLEIGSSLGEPLVQEMINNERALRYKVRLKKYENLPPPYDTECHDYEADGLDLSSNFGFEAHMTNPCADLCFQNTLRTQHNCTNSKNEIYVIDTEGNIALASRENYDLELCEQVDFLSNKNKNKFYNSLKKECQAACSHEQPCVDYHYEVKRVFVFANSSSEDRFLRVRVKFDDSIPVPRYIATPKWTPFDLFYEVGSLISLWYGYAILGVIDEISQKITSLLRKVFLFCLLIASSFCDIAYAVLQKLSLIH